MDLFHISLIFNPLSVAPDSVRFRAFGFFGIGAKICENLTQNPCQFFTNFAARVYKCLIFCLLWV